MDSVRKFKKLKFSRKREERGNNGECSKDDVEPNPLERIEQLEHIKSILCRNIIEIQNTCEEKDREMDALRGKVTELENTLKQKDIGRSQLEPNLLESNEEEERGNNGEYSKEDVEPNPLELIEHLEHLKSFLYSNIIEILNVCKEKDREMDALHGKITELENTLKQKDTARSQVEMTLRSQKEEFIRILEDTRSRWKEVETIIKNETEENDIKLQEQANKINELEKLCIELRKELDEKDTEWSQVEMTLHRQIEEMKERKEETESLLKSQMVEKDRKLQKLVKIFVGMCVLLSIFLLWFL